MPTLIIPGPFLALLTAFAPCFHAPTSANFAVLVAGWVHCLGRRTVTAVVLAAGAGGSPPYPGPVVGSDTAIQVTNQRVSSKARPTPQWIQHHIPCAKTQHRGCPRRLSSPSR